MNDHPTAEEWFMEALRAGQNDPDFLTEELLLDITEQIYIRMQDNGVRPTDLAEQLGVSRAYVSQVLNGKPNLTLRTLVRLAHALDLRVRVALEDKTGQSRRDVRGYTRRVLATMERDDDSIEPAA